MWISSKIRLYLCDRVGHEVFNVINRSTSKLVPVAHCIDILCACEKIHDTLNNTLFVIFFTFPIQNKCDLHSVKHKKHNVIIHKFLALNSIEEENKINKYEFAPHQLNQIL